MINTVEYYKVNANWQSRVETPAMLAERLIKLIGLLRPIDPLVSRWFHWVNETDRVDMRDHVVDIPDFVAAGVSRDDDDVADPYYGYHFHANNTPADTPDDRTLQLWMNAGSQSKLNFLDIKTSSLVLPGPDILNYRLFRGVLLAVAEAFEPEFAFATPTDLGDRVGFNFRRYPRASAMPPCWMIYLDAALAKSVAPPPSMIHETCPDGGLFIAATDEPFSTSNPAHLAAAKAIGDLLDPLNRTVPFGIYDPPA